MKHFFSENSAFGSGAIATLSTLLTDLTFSDFTFVVRGKEFKVHRNILGLASPVMMELFTADMIEKREGICKVDNIEPPVFKAMLDFVYCQNYSVINNTKLPLLYEAAHYFEIDSLLKYCDKRIQKQLTEANAITTYEFAYRYDLEELKSKSWVIIKR
jgi:BTB/POZ domain